MINTSKENMIMNTDYTWNLSLIELLDLLQQPVDDYGPTPLTNQEAARPPHGSRRSQKTTRPQQTTS